MKKTLFTLFAGVLLSQAYAQDFSAGVRSGVGNSFNAIDPCNGNNAITWDKEAYIRYNTKGKFAYELRMTHFSTQNFTDLSGIVFFEAPKYWPVSRITNTQNYVLGASAQYDITCSKMKEHCPLMKKLTNYIGVDIALVGQSNRDNSYYRDNADNTLYATSSRYTSFDLLAGVSNTLVYSLTPNLNVSGTARVMVSPEDFQKHTATKASHMNLLVGLGYSF